MDDAKLPQQWKPGRPLGARNRFSESFIDDVAKAWQENGEGILKIMAVEEPSKFAELCARLCPKRYSPLAYPAGAAAS